MRHPSKYNRSLVSGDFVDDEVEVREGAAVQGDTEFDRFRPAQQVGNQATVVDVVSREQVVGELQVTAVPDLVNDETD